MARLAVIQVLCLIASFGLAAADSIIELSADHLGVHTDHVYELLNATDYSGIDATPWSETFQQPVDVIVAWPTDFKNDALANLARMLHKGVAITSVHMNKRNNAASDKHYNQEEKTLDDQEEVKEKADKQKCGSIISKCAACIGIASVAYGGAISGCTAAGITAEAGTVAETLGAVTPIIWLGYIKCVSAAFAVYGTAAIACYKLT